MAGLETGRSDPDSRHKRICVAGICTVDAVAQYIDRYPPPGGLTSFDTLTLTTGGNAVNCTIALGKLGLTASVITKVGNDRFGDMVLSRLEAHGLDTSGVIRSDDAHTPFSFVCVQRDGQRSFLHTVGTNGTLRLEEINLGLVRASGLFLVTGTMLLPALDGGPTATLLREARAAGAVTLLDTSFVDAASPLRWRAAVEPVLPHLDFFLPSRPEAMALTGHDDPAKAAETLLNGGCRNVVIKLDRKGVFYRGISSATGIVPAYRVDPIVDTTGAGDCWCAGFLAGLALDMATRDALLLGNAVAAHGIRHPGASDGVPSLAEVFDYQASTPHR